MKRILKIILRPISLFALAASMIFVLPGMISAFHEGGVDFCEGCHIVNISANNPFQDGDVNAKPGELKGFDPSSTCLRCHAVGGKFFNVLSIDGSSFSAAGDFFWLKKTFTWTENGRLYQSAGDDHGHNIAAAEYGLYEAHTLGSAPGSGLSSTAILGCTSCHDPHSINAKNGDAPIIPAADIYGQDFSLTFNAGNYRLLGGIGYNAGASAGGVSFKYPAPIAAADAQNWVETDAHHTAYGSGMSKWCGNCHLGFLTGKDKHPVGKNAKLSNTFISNYNSYVKTGDITGTKAAAYLALVPFESGTADKLSLDPASTSGPSQGANVMCLTCHRAHASAFQNMNRWDFGATFIAKSHPQLGDRGVTADIVQNSYYGRDIVSQFGLYQRRLCNKCHLLD